MVSIISRSGSSGRLRKNLNPVSDSSYDHGPGSPGGAFKLSENALSERLERLPVWTGLTYDDTTGMRIVLRREAVDASERVTALSRYYGVHPEIRSHDREMQELTQ